MFRDLNLDQVFAAAVSGRDEYDLMPFFRTPLHDARAVAYRHEVQRDLDAEPLGKAVAEFGLRMREMRQDLELSGKLRTRYQKEHWLLEAARVYVQAVGALARALDTSELVSAGSPGSGPTSRSTPDRRHSPAWRPTSRR
jgi:DNA mismatch repair protein MutS